jgi:hypothetical protein
MEYCYAKRLTISLAYVVGKGQKEDMLNKDLAATYASSLIISRRLRYTIAMTLARLDEYLDKINQKSI